MGISRLTAMMIQANPVRIIDNAERSEAWLVKDDQPHAMLCSCLIAERDKMQEMIDELQSGKLNAFETLWAKEQTA